MGITLYTSRVVLKALGEVDYGIFSVVGGTVIFFTFLSNSMATALQRHMAYAIGERNQLKLINYFNQGFWTFAIIGIICIILCESIGLYILHYYIDIPPLKVNTAFWVYQLAVGNMIIGLLRTPYIGLIIAHEKMNFFAFQGIIEGLMKLGVALAIMYLDNNRLIDYMILLLMTTVVNNIYTRIYCRKKFPNCRLNLKIDFSIIKSLMAFSGWTVMTSASNVLSNQGVAIVLNNIYGVLISAAVGITNQVFAALSTFLGGFQASFNPQII